MPAILQPGPTRRRPKGMNATAETSAEHTALLQEYRIALRLWTEARALYGSTIAPEVIEANSRVEVMERKLRDYRLTHSS